MKLLVNFFTSLNPFTKRLSLCGNVGLIAGAISGTLLMLLDIIHGGLILTTDETWKIGLLLGVFTWIVVMFFLVILARLTFRSVAIPALVNCILTCLGMIFLTRALGLYVLAWLIGIVVGIIIGMILCRFNFFFNKLIKS